MPVRCLLYEAIFGKSLPEAPREVSRAGALTSGFFEVSQAMNTTAGDVQNSLDLIASAATSILRMERVVILLKERGEEEVAARAAGVRPPTTPLDRRELSETDLKLLSVMANFAGVAIENANLVGRLHRKAKKLTAIFQISRALNEESNPAVLFQLIIDHATDLM